MATKRRTESPPDTPRRNYFGADIPMRVIRRFARQVAERFRPDKIILFGSHAYGTPHADSDVDILVVMPCRNQLDQAARIPDKSRPHSKWTSSPPRRRTCDGDSRTATCPTQKS